MLLLTGAIYLPIVVCYTMFRHSSSVFELSDGTFEHDTQAISGGTTGPWMIAVFAPWCMHCKVLLPTWEEVGRSLKGDVNVAVLDATKNPLSPRRFAVKGFPTIMLLTEGEYFLYRGMREMNDIANWARETIKQKKQNSIKGEKIPPEVVESFSDVLNRFVNTRRIKDFLNRSPLLAVGIIVTGFIAFLMCLLALCGSRKEKVDPAAEGYERRMMKKDETKID